MSDLMLMQGADIGKLKLKNRIIMAPMGTVVGNLSPRAVEYFVERAKGGAAMIMCNIAATDVLEDVSHSIFLNEESTPYFKEICDRSHEYGCLVCAQLHPGNGRIGGPSTRYKVPISASATPWMHVPKYNCHELTVEEIGLLREGFRQSVKTAIACGADAIEIHAYGGYLTDQFLTRRWNLRTDEYGGDMDGRLRFLRELMEVVRTEGGADYPLIVKYCPDHFLPAEEGYRDLEEGLELTRKLCELGADALHVDAGCHDIWYNAMPPGYMQELSPQAKSAKAVSEICDIPVLTHGRFSDTEKAEAVLRNGVCDFAVIGRGLLADPELPNKLNEGSAEDIRPCISCNEGCIARSYALKNASCAVNPLCGREIYGGVKKTSAPKRVLVVGAGPGGCSAALYAAEAGHEVTLWERSTVIGGNALAASKPYFKGDMHDLINYYRVQLAKSNVTVRFGIEASYDNIAEFKPEHIIWAVGGRPLMPSAIGGLDGYNVASATDALRNLVHVGKRVLMVGGGMVGVEAALHYDRLGHEVTLVELEKKMLPAPMFKMNEDLLRYMMKNSNINFMPKTKLCSVESTRLKTVAHTENEQGTESAEYDTVLMALGFAPRFAETERLGDICPVTVIGDAKEARKVIYAVEEAFEAVNEIE